MAAYADARDAHAARAASTRFDATMPSPALPMRHLRHRFDAIFDTPRLHAHTTTTSRRHYHVSPSVFADFTSFHFHLPFD